MEFTSYLMTKTQYAFTFTCEEYFRVNPEVYFWTFTFKSVPITDDYAMMDWNTFAARLARHFPWAWGVRVTELHRSHGIHFHFFLNGRIPLDRMRRMTYGTGGLVGHNRYTDFGRMSVQKCDKSPESIAYLACYLTKSYRQSNWFGQRRRWGCLGGFKPSRCRDIVYESEATRNREMIFGATQCSYTAIMMTTYFTNLYGPVLNWPMECLTLVQAQPLANGSALVKHRYENEPF